MAEADAVGEGDAALVQRSPQGRAGLGERQRLQLARGDHLRQHHGGGLERLDLLLGVDPARPVLHDEDAEGVAGPQQRHAEEGVVDLLARLRLVGEGRVRLGVGQRERLGRRGDEADEALARGHRREVHGGAVEAFGGEQFEGAVAPHHVDGADLRHHVGGDQDDDLVEALLRADRLRHDLAEAAQKDARTAVSGWHGLYVPVPSRRSLRRESLEYLA